MRFTLPLLALLLACALVGSASARAHERAAAPATLRSLRSLVDHYRSVTWTYERAAHRRRTPTSYSERRSVDGPYLRWSLARWTRRAESARRAAVGRIERRLSVRLPRAPRLHARLWRRLSYSRRLALSLRRIYPGNVSRSFALATRHSGGETLRLWQRRSALAAVAVAEHGLVPAWLKEAFLCIHRYEGAWSSNSGNGYYGGLQMDRPFQARYGPRFLGRWGTADNWPAWAQIQAAVHAYRAGRGFGPWPSTARFCGLI